MSSVPFHYVDLRAFAYATEDEKRVAEALQTYLPEETELERAESEGHYGDRIVVLSARVENADDIRHVLTQVAAVDDLEAVLEELDDRVDDNCSFFLTFDKQAAFGNSVERGDGITLRAKVEAYPAKRETAIENAQDALSEL
ncbi:MULTISPECIES: RNA-binding protein [Halomicrobium]|uniref:RNA-binding protein n=1 Tax=Halomicrobium mukohataei TaxID=57705 RepID=A0A847U4Y0_9EURY|nr:MULTISPECIES: RNA-binding protein [Halomicrobium]MBO4246228.1 RNA-binding protein [Halomicrobium sp. IBSBa]NLV10743.1 RNA-binding protein [Halomicrobium mukohataei]QGA82796.1 RNA-binding protein [Halomicrobium sp. LC1Hm]